MYFKISDNNVDNVGIIKWMISNMRKVSPIANNDE